MYYVYAHYDEGEIVYVGKGCMDRAYTSRRRQPEHMEWMNYNIINEIKFVDMVSRNLSEDEANTFEKLLIAKLQPRWNKLGVKGSISKPKLKGRKRPEHSEFMKRSGVVPTTDSKAVAESNKRRTGETRNHPKVTCPNCGKKGGVSNMRRYHFDNCRNFN